MTTVLLYVRVLKNACSRSNRSHYLTPHTFTKNVPSIHHLIPPSSNTLPLLLVNGKSCMPPHTPEITHMRAFLLLEKIHIVHHDPRKHGFSAQTQFRRETILHAPLCPALKISASGHKQARRLSGNPAGAIPNSVALVREILRFGASYPAAASRRYGPLSVILVILLEGKSFLFIE